MPLKTTNSNRRNNVIDFSKGKRNLSHIKAPKKSKKIKLPPIKFFCIAILLLVMAVSGYKFMNSQYAMIQKLTITGNFLLEEQEILVNLPKIGQANFFRTSKNHFIEILKENPWIKDVVVKRDFVLRTVELDIVERRPLFRTITDSVIEVISEDGLVIPDRTGFSRANVPFVMGSNDQKVLISLIEHIKDIPDFFLKQLSEINIENTASVDLFTIDGFIIKVGVIENLTPSRVLEIQQIIDLEKYNGNTGTIDIRGQNIIFTSNLEG